MKVDLMRRGVVEVSPGTKIRRGFRVMVRWVRVE